MLALRALILLAATANAPVGPGSGSDYPVVVGDPFTVNGKTYTPIDVMNYDAVGRAIVGVEGGTTISAAHRTLPLPSYAEVTSLEGGRTILVRVERRGPMSGDALIELSPGAAAQLGIAARTPVRVRRVNPPEPERAVLRVGQQAPLRLDTPKGLLAALQRKLATQDGVTPTLASVPALTVAAKPAMVPAKPTPKPIAMKPTGPAVTPAPVKPEAKPASGSLVVQVGAYSTKDRAAAVAAKVGGNVGAAGKLFRVRIGPLTTQGLAVAALAKAKAAGYIDARIQHVD